MFLFNCRTLILWYGVGGVECRCCCCVRTEWWVLMLGWQKLQWKDQTSPYWQISYFSVLHLPGLCMWWSVSMYGFLPLPILCLWLAFMHVCVHVCMCACVCVFYACITHQGHAQYFLWTSQACGLLGLVSWGLHQLNWWWLYMKVVVCMHECIFWSRTLWGNQKCKVVRRIFGVLLWEIQNWLEKWLQVAIKKKSSWVWVSARKSRIREGWGCNSGFCATCRPVARAQQAGCHKSSLVQRPGMYATLMTSQLWSGWPSHTTTHTCPVSLALFLSFSLSLSFFLIILSMPCTSVCCCSSDTRAVRKIEALICLFRCYTLGKSGHSQMAVSSTVACERTPPTQQYRQLDVLLAPGTPFFLCLSWLWSLESHLTYRVFPCIRGLLSRSL